MCTGDFSPKKNNRDDKVCPVGCTAVGWQCWSRDRELVIRLEMKKKNHTAHSCSPRVHGICALGSALASHLPGDAIEGVKVEMVIYGLMVIRSSLLNCPLSFLAGPVTAEMWKFS